MKAHASRNEPANEQKQLEAAFCVELSRWIKETRTRTGITQEAWAAAVGADSRTLWNWENRRTRPTLKSFEPYVRVIAEKFGIPLDASSEWQGMFKRAKATVARTTTQSPKAHRATAKLSEYVQGAHLYWLGSDLWEALHLALSTDDKVTSTRCLSQARRHFRKAGFRDTWVEDTLTRIIERSASQTLETWALPTKRRDLQRDIVSVKNRINVMVKERAGPEFNGWED